MIGLKLANICIVMTAAGMIVYCCMKRREPAWEMPRAFLSVARMALVGIPLGLILAILGL